MANAKLKLKWLDFRKVSTYPKAPLNIAKLGEPVLQTPALPIDDFAEPELKRFCEDLLNAMQAANGIGIAAPQVFCSRQIMYIASRPNKRYPDAPDMEPLLLINPVIETQSRDVVSGWEGCLSVPALRGKVNRSDAVLISYYDINGNAQEAEFNGFLARIFLHEYDHLIGKTYLNHISDQKDLVSEEFYLKHIVA